MMSNFVWSNKYATLGRWSEARVARKIMRKTGVNKLSGDSVIIMKDKVDYFYTKDSLLKGYS